MQLPSRSPSWKRYLYRLPTWAGSAGGEELLAVGASVGELVGGGFIDELLLPELMEEA